RRPTKEGQRLISLHIWSSTHPMGEVVPILKARSAYIANSPSSVTVRPHIGGCRSATPCDRDIDPAPIEVRDVPTICSECRANPSHHVRHGIGHGVRRG